jgi:hypothetical protein
MSWDNARPSFHPTPADGCRCLRMTESCGLILAPVHRPGAGRDCGVYERVGLIEVRDYQWKVQRLFENLEWVNSVVTII